MPEPRFHSLSQSQFAEILDAYPWRRRILEVHVHHTWRPNHAQWNGLDTIVGMWRFHTEVQKWSDIAQHVTVAPDGQIWTGRDWNLPPASAKGFNGGLKAGPFMIEIVGDFDQHQDRFEGQQRASVLFVVAALLHKASLPDSSVRFHCDMSVKTCPGSSFVYDDFLKEVKAARAGAKAAAKPAARGLRPFGDQELQLRQVVADLQADLRARAAAPSRVPALDDGELSEDTSQDWQAVASRGGGAGELEVTPELLAELAPHVVNLNQGRFSNQGQLTTSPGDVDAIFDQHLPAAWAEAQHANRPLRIVFYAHGGLSNEASGIRRAYEHMRFWRANDVYPIYFVWETGFWGTVGQLLGMGHRAVAARGARAIQDPIIEFLAHKPGEKVWSGMKYSAQRAADPPAPAGAPATQYGGAFYVAQKLQGFLTAHTPTVELHAVGHSAGSIFHSHFLPAARALGVPAFDGTYFLAPAISVAAFKQRLAPLLAGAGMGHLTIFTMKKALELADTCGGVYHKSLLYLIHHALEPERQTPILGLEESIRGDAELRAWLGLQGQAGAPGEVVWSKSAATSGRGAAQSTTHGGFDDDVATMDSLLRRVLRLSDTGGTMRSYSEFRLDRERGLDLETRDAAEMEAHLDAVLGPVQPFTAAAASTGWPAPAVALAPAVGGGRRRALCVGIDRYATSPLLGCVADARLWARTLQSLGFEPPLLIEDAAATRGAILDGLATLIGSSRAGDLLVFQYSGHGTQMPDLDGDEGDDGKDEALCPSDYESGAFVIDDDLAEVFAGLPTGVGLTCFLDSCHSGSGSRLAVGANSPHRDPTARVRRLNPTDAMRAAHASFRGRRGAPRTTDAVPGGIATMREVTFSACQPHQQAWEHGGQGDFTRYAVGLLAAGAAAITNEEFFSRVEAAFGAAPAQLPFLDCAPPARRARFLEPPVGGAQPAVSAIAGAPAPDAAIEQLARALAAVVRR